MENQNYSIEDVMTALRAADEAGNVEDARKLATIADRMRKAPAAKKDDGFGFLEETYVGLLDAAEERFGQQGKTIADAYMKGDQGLASTTLQMAGKVGAGLVMDAIGEVLINGGKEIASHTPEEIKDPLKSGASYVVHAIATSDVGRAGLEKAKEGIVAYKEWAEEHPVVARNLDAVVNIAALLAPVKGKPKVKPSATTRAGDKLIRSGQRSEFKNRKAFIEKLVKPDETPKKAAERIRAGHATVDPKTQKRTFELSPLERDSVTVLEGIRGVSPKNTLTQNHNIVRNYVNKQADQLEKALGGLGTRGVYFGRELKTHFNQTVKPNLDDVLAGDAAKIADKVIAKAEKLASQNPRTLAGLLKTRRELDAWAERYSTNIFSEGVDSARKTAVREVRDQINEFIAQRAGSRVGYKQSLFNQSRALRAMDDISTKAAKEANTRLGRAVQNVIKLLPLRSEFNNTMAAIFGVGGLGAAAIFAPFFTKLAAGAIAGYAGKRAIMSPKTRIGLGKLIKHFDEAIQYTTDPAIISQLRADRAFVIELYKNAEESIEE